MFKTEIQAILFDMDGVLIDAKEWHYDALNRALRLFGLSISRLDHLTTFDGLPTRKKLELLSMEGRLPFELHEFINEMKQQYTMQIVHERCKPRFHHEYMLANLKGRGFRLAVCSNSVRSSIEAMLGKANLLHYFDFVVSNQDVELPKPAPDMYLKAIDFFRLNPQQCLILEDNENGIKAAQSSGAHLQVVSTVDEVHLGTVQRAIARANELNQRNGGTLGH